MENLKDFIKDTLKSWLFIILLSLWIYFIFTSNYFSFITKINFLLIFYVLGGIYLFWKNPYQLLNSKNYSYLLFGSLLIGFLLLFYRLVILRYSMFQTSGLGFLFKTFLIIASIVAVLLGLYYIIKFGINYSGVSSTTAFVMFSILFFFCLALIVSLLKNLPKKKGNLEFDEDSSSFFSLLKNIVLFIPCYIIEWIEFFKNQYNITTRTDVIIFTICILILASEYYVVKIINYFRNLTSNVLLKEPIYLNREMILRNEKIKVNPDYNYSISSWIYINPQPESTNANYNEDCVLLNYGNKPQIVYKGGNNMLKVLMETGIGEKKIIYKTDKFPLQKWNHVVLNYVSGTLDVFINDNLVASQKNEIPYGRNDTLISGYNNGIHGGICNVQYFEHPLSKKEIGNIYQTYERFDPPVI